MFASLLTGKIMGGFSLALLIIFAAFGVYHYFLVLSLEHTITKQGEKIASLNIKNAELTSENTKLTEANVKMAASIDVQNAKIKEMVDAQTTAVAAAIKVADAAVATAKKDKARYEALLTAPRTTSDDCKEASLKVNEYLQMRYADTHPPKTPTAPPTAASGEAR